MTHQKEVQMKDPERWDEEYDGRAELVCGLVLAIVALAVIQIVV